MELKKISDMEMAQEAKLHDSTSKLQQAANEIKTLESEIQTAKEEIKSLKQLVSCHHSQAQNEASCY